MVRIDDLVTLIDEIDKAMGYELQLRILETGMDAVATHLKKTEEAGEQPSRTVLDGLMKVYVRES